MKKVVFAALAVLVLFSCKNGVDVKYQVSSDDLEFASPGGELFFTIDANQSQTWTIEKSEGADWLSCHTSATTPEEFKYAGTGPNVIRVKAERYRPLGSRNATITVKASGESPVVINVIQNGPEVPSPAPLETVPIRSFSATEITIPIAEGYVSSVNFPSVAWATLKAKNDDDIVVSFQENATAANRSIDVPVKAEDGSLVQTLRIVQSWKNIEAGELKISEVFFTGYEINNRFYSDAVDGDQYIKLTNDTDETLYLDRVLFAVSKASSNQFAIGAVPSDESGIGVKAVYGIPGTGKDFPLEAGKSTVIALSAQDFTGVNPNIDNITRDGLDLSKSYFEIFDGAPDLDNATADDLDLWASETPGVFALSDKGFESYAIAIAPKSETAASFAAAHPWAANAGCFLIPNEWVLDAVNCGVTPEQAVTEGDYSKINTDQGFVYWNKSKKLEKDTEIFTDTDLTVAATDGVYYAASEQMVTVSGGKISNVQNAAMGFNATVDAGCVRLPGDETRYGMAVTRKADGDHLKDTGKSSDDFEVGTPSLR